MTNTIQTNTSRRALVVDDILVNRSLAVAILTKMGWQVDNVDSGSEALRWLSNNPAVDLILLDIKMPDLCGEDVCRELRANPAFSKVPIVAYTAHAMQADIDRFLENGFSAVAIKPVSIQGLKDVVRGLFPESAVP
jgi:CheY-like chemotaxis protein